LEVKIDSSKHPKHEKNWIACSFGSAGTYDWNKYKFTLFTASFQGLPMEFPFTKNAIE
jgi:hypothetical protein